MYSLSPNNASNRKAFSPIFNIFSLHHAVFVTLCYQIHMIILHRASDGANLSDVL